MLNYFVRIAETDNLHVVVSSRLLAVGGLAPCFRDWREARCSTDFARPLENIDRKKRSRRLFTIYSDCARAVKNFFLRSFFLLGTGPN